jgi:hypothetical protein
VSDRLVPAARAAALIFVAAAGAYLIHVSTTSHLAFWVGQKAERLSNPLLRMLIGLVVLDLSKVVGLLPAAWLLRRVTHARPVLVATALVVLCFGFELTVMLIIQPAQDAWQWWLFWLARIGAAAVLVWPVQRVIAAGRSPCEAS